MLHNNAHTAPPFEDESDKNDLLLALQGFAREERINAIKHGIDPLDPVQVLNWRINPQANDHAPPVATATDTVSAAALLPLLEENLNAL
jgi:hypothetical protein